MASLNQTQGHRFPSRSIKVSDFLDQDLELDSPEDSLSADDTLMAGEFLHQQLREGLFLHVSNAREEHAFTVRSQIREGLSCVFFLEGNVDLKVGDRRFNFRGGENSVLEGTAIVSTRSDSFERSSRGAQPLRHLVITASPEWLGLDGLSEIQQRSGISTLMKDHLNTHRWTATPRMIELVRQIAAPSQFAEPLRNLFLEGRAIELVGETLMAMTNGERVVKGNGAISGKDNARLSRAKEFIAANLTAMMTVEMIAREAGLNPSGLQHIFRAAEGVSIFEYVRSKRLELALTLLRSGTTTVAEAAKIAGYSSPTNFAKAFKRAFGISPREAPGSH